MASPEIERSILGALVQADRPEAMINAMQVASKPVTYESMFEIVMEMENKNHIKLVYCVHPTVINVQLTLVGEAAYQNIR